MTTRKLLTMNGSFHQSSDTNRLYAKRNDGGRGIKICIKIEGQEEIDSKQSYNWFSLRLTSHLEGFICAMQEQEIDTKSMRKTREKDQEKRKRMNSSCRICRMAKENLFHVLGACPILAPTLYLISRHNQVAIFYFYKIFILNQQTTIQPYQS